MSNGCLQMRKIGSNRKGNGNDGSWVKCLSNFSNSIAWQRRCESFSVTEPFSPGLKNISPKIHVNQRNKVWHIDSSGMKLSIEFGILIKENLIRIEQ